MPLASLHAYVTGGVAELLFEIEMVQLATCSKHYVLAASCHQQPIGVADYAAYCTGVLIEPLPAIILTTHSVCSTNCCTTAVTWTVSNAMTIVCSHGQQDDVKQLVAYA